MQKLFYKLRMFFAVVPVMLAQPKRLLANRRGENFIGSGFKVLIVVVLAALLLAGLYALFSGLIMPMLEERVTDLFNYKG